MSYQNIKEKVEEANALPPEEKPDCICIVRGGGPAEDLVQYSHPDLVKAVYNSGIPVLIGIGHAGDDILCEQVVNPADIQGDAKKENKKRKTLPANIATYISRKMYKIAQSEGAKKNTSKTQAAKAAAHTNRIEALEKEICALKEENQALKEKNSELIRQAGEAFKYWQGEQLKRWQGQIQPVIDRNIQLQHQIKMQSEASPMDMDRMKFMERELNEIKKMGFFRRLFNWPY